MESGPSVLSPGAAIGHQQSQRLVVFKGFLCPTCGFKIEDETKIIEHLRQHVTKVTHCPLCPKSSTYWTVTALHIVHVHAERSFQCGVCGSMFPTSRDCKRHADTHTMLAPGNGPNQGPGYRFNGYLCPICEQKFDTEFTQHITQHTKGRQCALCQDHFKSLNVLARHYLSHNHEKPFQCDKCDSVFVIEAKCKTHVRRCQSQLIEVDNPSRHESTTEDVSPSTIHPCEISPHNRKFEPLDRRLLERSAREMQTPGFRDTSPTTTDRLAGLYPIRLPFMNPT